ncbi:hypothetical protein KCU88_g113, partial [Aureobasidium melanogenum]
MVQKASLFVESDCRNQIHAHKCGQKANSKKVPRESVCVCAKSNIVIIIIVDLLPSNSGICHAAWADIDTSPKAQRHLVQMCIVHDLATEISHAVLPSAEDRGRITPEVPTVADHAAAVRVPKGIQAEQFHPPRQTAVGTSGNGFESGRGGGRVVERREEVMAVRRGRDIVRRRGQKREIREDETDVVVAHAVGDPRTVVVLFGHAAVAAAAVFRP